MLGRRTWCLQGVLIRAGRLGRSGVRRARRGSEPTGWPSPNSCPDASEGHGDRDEYGESGKPWHCLTKLHAKQVEEHDPGRARMAAEAVEQVPRDVDPIGVVRHR